MDAAPEPVGLVLARRGAGFVYERRLETLYGAVDVTRGALAGVAVRG